MSVVRYVYPLEIIKSINFTSEPLVIEKHLSLFCPSILKPLPFITSPVTSLISTELVRKISLFSEIFNPFVRSKGSYWVGDGDGNEEGCAEIVGCDEGLELGKGVGCGVGDDVGFVGFGVGRDVGFADNEGFDVGCGEGPQLKEAALWPTISAVLTPAPISQHRYRFNEKV